LQKGPCEESATQRGIISSVNNFENRTLHKTLSKRKEEIEEKPAEGKAEYRKIGPLDTEQRVI